jgi:hypothetical protein
MKGPQSGGPAAKGPASEPAQGAADTTPPPAEGSGGNGGGSSQPKWLWIAGLAAVAIVGGLVYKANSGAPAPTPAIEQPAPAPAAGQPAATPTPAAARPAAPATRTLRLGAADVDHVATDLAKKLIASGSLPAPGATDPAAVAPPASPLQATGGTPGPTAQSTAPASDQVVHRPPLKASTPRTAPAPAPAAETQRVVRQVLVRAPAETRQAIAQGRSVIYTLHVIDKVQEDGDVVEVFVNGNSQGRVLLSNSGEDLLVPLPAGSTAKVHVVALRDGGGGVTFGVTTSLGEIRSTVLAVGESDDWSVQAQ